MSALYGLLAAAFWSFFICAIKKSKGNKENKKDKQ